MKINRGKKSGDTLPLSKIFLPVGIIVAVGTGTEWTLCPEGLELMVVS